MRAGNLDRRITIQTISGAQDSVTGEWRNGVWSDLVTLWAGKESRDGRERMLAHGVISIGDEVFVIRHRTDIDESMRVSYNSNQYEIKSIIEIGRGEGLKLITQRVF